MSQRITRRVCCLLMGVLLAVGGVAQASHRFVDVPDGHIFHEEVSFVADRQITVGCTADGLNYCPEDPVTRAQMAAFLLRSIVHDAHLPSYQGYFQDVPDGQWYTGFVEHLREHEITRGCNPEGTLYCPEQQVTREQMASFLVRTFRFPATDRDYFTDDQGSVHEADINALREAGVTVGCNPEGTLYCPVDPVLRGEMAAFLTRSLQNGQACHQSYPDFCIPPPPPDLDCSDVSRRNFTVLSPDPHGFDGDGDGVGCEA